MFHKSISVGLVLLCLSPLSILAASDTKMDSFITKLLSKMDLEEKASQLTQYSADMKVTGPEVNPAFKSEVKAGRVGSIFNAFTPKFNLEIQKLAVDKTTDGAASTATNNHIPLLFGFDVIHGHRTIFPIPLGESSSWDLKLIEKTALVSAEEAKADGLHWVFAPMVDIARDPRWGRVSEGSGEDTWLGSKVAVARVKGTQNAGVLACVKHFAAYGAPIAGREYNSVNMSLQELHESYLPPYKAAVDAGVASIMPAFNSINGKASTSNKKLLTNLLRKEWGFKGIVVSDYTAVHELVEHRQAENDEEAVYLAFKAGIEMEMQGGIYLKYLPKLVREKRISVAELDRAVRHVLEAKYKLGLFKNPHLYTDQALADKTILSKEMQAHALDVARKSIVLLKNDNNALPIKAKGTIALIGPFVANQRDQIGNWSADGRAEETVSFLEGMTKAINGRAKILYEKGSNYLEDKMLHQFLDGNQGDLTMDARTPEEMIEDAVSLVKKADFIIVALGETQGMSGEAGARGKIRIPENQLALLEAVSIAAKKKDPPTPVILTIANGRPLVLVKENKLADAIVETWYLGTQAGSAIADVILGNFNPAGKLTMTFPFDEGQIPIYYNELPTGRPALAAKADWSGGPSDPTHKYTSQYLDMPNSPLFPFGFGLSYSKFEYSGLKLGASVIKPRDKLKVSVTVTNVSSVDGEEVVQLYVSDLISGTARPLKQLRGFEKVFIKAGESKEVQFVLNHEDLKYYDENLQWISEPGEFSVMVGGNSRDLTQQSKFRLVRK